MLAFSLTAQAQFKLVRVDKAGTMITGKDLQNILIDEKFTVPDCPRQALDYPKPERPDCVRLFNNDCRDKWELYNIELKAYKAEYEALMAQRKAIYTHFTLVLAKHFVIATYGKTGNKLPDGRPEIGWFIQEKPGYTFEQFAMILTGFNTKAWDRGDPIEWISFKANNEY